MKTYLGIELGSTRIKAVSINETFTPVSSGDHEWKSSYQNGIWTYDLEDAWNGIKTALQNVGHRDSIQAIGISAMMHGFLAFDKDWKLLTPFRTWQNTITGHAASELTKLFNFNIPQRWSIAHLYQAILNKEDYVSDIAHITTLAGYIHYMLTGVNAVGIGEASGIFPINSTTLDYDNIMLMKFDKLISSYNFSWKLTDLLPKTLVAGETAGSLTKEGAMLLDNLLAPGIPFAPAEGDAGTGMTATNAVAPRTGNVSAGTSIFSMVVLERPLKHVYEEVDMVTTPTGKPVAMVHCNNCTNDSNAWVSLFKETLELFGANVPTGELYTKLYKKSLEGNPDCDGVLVCNYMAGESVTHLDLGRPLVVRKPDSVFSLANFFRAQLYGAMATLKIGMELLEREQVKIDSLTGHGGLFKTSGVGQRYMAAACNAPVTCMTTAGEGGPYGMALLASFTQLKVQGELLEDFLTNRVFCNASHSILEPTQVDIDGFNSYMKQYKQLLKVEKTATELI